MVLILSNLADKSTIEVIDWLNMGFVRISKENYLISLDIHMGNDSSNSTLNLSNSKKIDTNKIYSYWYRRDCFVLDIDLDKINIDDKRLRDNLDKEWEKLNTYIQFHLKSKRSLGCFYKELLQNKLEVLSIAQAFELKIPLTLITTRRSSLISFVQKYGDCITKTIGNMFKIEHSNYAQTISTQLVTENLLSTLGERFFPTLVQKKVEKVFELRIFYMKSQFYPMAIFSQNDEKTKLDYRNYNREKPNRNIPYVLPKAIEEKLQKLMDKLDLDSGSIDMIVTPEEEYVFLEVNPTGQFGWVSENCNYYLEEKIANYLQSEA